MVDVCVTTFTLKQLREIHNKYKIGKPGECDDFINFVAKYYCLSEFGDGTYVELEGCDDKTVSLATAGSKGGTDQDSLGDKLKKHSQEEIRGGRGGATW